MKGLDCLRFGLGRVSASLLAMGFLPVLASCGGADSAVPRVDSVERPNIVFVTIDALRRDRLGAYGYSRATSPFIDTLAESGVVFENCVASAPWTAAAMASLWTSQPPSYVGVRTLEEEDGVRNLAVNRVTPLHTNAETLAEALSLIGYTTGAVVTGVKVTNFDDGKPKLGHS